MNGTGKTTCTAKLAAFLKKRGPQRLLAAADTFRAAAIEQLGVWADRIGCPIVKGQYNADPAAVCFDAYQKADKREHRVPHLRHRRPPAHEAQPHGRTRQSEAHPRKRPTPPRRTRRCSSSMPPPARTPLEPGPRIPRRRRLTGLIVTKLDGSGKGGVVVAIHDELGIPTRFIGTGEKLEDFAFFDSREFAEAML